LFAVVSLALVGGIGLASTVSSKAYAPNPDDALTHTERIAAHEQNTARFWDRYKVWLAEQDMSDLRAYPRDELLATVQEAAPTLADSAKRAQLIVSGRVDHVEFRPTPDVVLTVRVDEVLKGEPSIDQIKVIVPCMLQPSSDWKNATISCAEALPLLYPGDVAILLLQSNGDGETFGIQPWTGTYFTSGDSVRAVAGNPFQVTTELMSPDALKEFLRAFGN
jgi:hypothetical protein